MEIFNRSTLKGFFQKGKVPTEAHFTNLIDSTLNKLDDGIAKTVEHGLKLAPGGGRSKKVISFFNVIKDKNPLWSLSVNPTEVAQGLSFQDIHNQDRIFIKDQNGVGIGTTDPNYDLEVAGTMASKARVGTFKPTIGVPADAEWHTVLDQLDGCHAFEIVAKVEGVKKRGKYAMAHCIAICANGGRQNKIRTTQACYGWFWHRIMFRWRRNNLGNYTLQIKTNSHYGVDNENNVINIKFHITSLWATTLNY